MSDKLENWVTMSNKRANSNPTIEQTFDKLLLIDATKQIKNADTGDDVTELTATQQKEKSVQRQLDQVQALLAKTSNEMQQFKRLLRQSIVETKTVQDELTEWKQKRTMMTQIVQGEPILIAVEELVKKPNVIDNSKQEAESYLDKNNETEKRQSKRTDQRRYDYGQKRKQSNPKNGETLKNCVRRQQQIFHRKARFKSRKRIELDFGGSNHFGGYKYYNPNKRGRYKEFRRSRYSNF